MIRNWIQIFVGCAICGTCFVAGLGAPRWWSYLLLLVCSAGIQVALAWGNKK